MKFNTKGLEWWRWLYLFAIWFLIPGGTLIVLAWLLAQAGLIVRLIHGNALQFNGRLIFSRCFVMPTERRQCSSGFHAQAGIRRAKLNGGDKIGDGRSKPAAADAKARQRGQIVRLVHAMCQRRAVTLLRVVGAPHFLVELTQRQPARAIIRFQGEGVFELDDSLVAAAKFLEARSEVEPAPNGLRIERQDMLKGRGRIPVFVFLRQQNAIKQPASGIAGHQIQRVVGCLKCSGIILEGLFDLAQLLP